MPGDRADLRDARAHESRSDDHDSGHTTSWVRRFIRSYRPRLLPGNLRALPRIAHTAADPTVARMVSRRTGRACPRARSWRRCPRGWGRIPRTRAPRGGSRRPWCTPARPVPPARARPPPDVGRLHGGPGEPCPAAHQRVMTIGPHVGTEPRDLVDEPEPRLEQVLRDHRRAVGDGVQGDELRLQVGREARVGQGDDVDGAGRSSMRDAEAVLLDMDHGPADASLSSAMSRCLPMAPRTTHVAAGDRGSDRPGAGDDPVGDVACSTGFSSSTPSTVRVEEPGALDPRAHLDQHLADVDDLRLPGGVVDDGDALGQDRGHQEVLRRPDAREVQPDLAAVQRAGLGDEEPVLVLERGAEASAARRCACRGPRSRSRRRRAGRHLQPAARDQRAEHAIEARITAYEVVVGLVVRGRRGTSIVTVPPASVPAVVDDDAAQPPQQLGHDRHVEDVRDVGDRACDRGASRAAAISFRTLFFAPTTPISPSRR